MVRAGPGAQPRAPVHPRSRCAPAHTIAWAVKVSRCATTRRVGLRTVAPRGPACRRAPATLSSGTPRTRSAALASMSPHSQRARTSWPTSLRLCAATAASRGRHGPTSPHVCLGRQPRRWRAVAEEGSAAPCPLRPMHVCRYRLRQSAAGATPAVTLALARRTVPSAAPCAQGRGRERRGPDRHTCHSWRWGEAAARRRPQLPSTQPRRPQLWPGQPPKQRPRPASRRACDRSSPRCPACCAQGVPSRRRRAPNARQCSRPWPPQTPPLAATPAATPCSLSSSACHRRRRVERRGARRGAVAVRRRCAQRRSQRTGAWQRRAFSATHGRGEASPPSRTPAKPRPRGAGSSSNTQRGANGPWCRAWLRVLSGRGEASGMCTWCAVARAFARTMLSSRSTVREDTRAMHGCSHMYTKG